MPLYDCMLLLKPQISKEAMMDLVTRVGKHVYNKNGVITDMKSYGTINLGYGIKKLDGRHYQGQMFQMTMMSPPTINKELHYLNKEDRLLRWLLVKHRDVKFGLDSFAEDDFLNYELGTPRRSSLFNNDDFSKNVLGTSRRSPLFNNDDDDDDDNDLVFSEADDFDGDVYDEAEEEEGEEEEGDEKKD